MTSRLRGRVRVTLLQVKALSANDNARQATVVLGTTPGNLALGFLIPMNEANRLARVLGLTRCRCAPVYDLIRDLAISLCASVTRAVLDAEAEGICATLVLEREGIEFALPCHPADAIALALLTNTPIYATADALAHSCPLAQREGQEIAHLDVARWLEGVRPKDFEG
jgi:bifunctional DNase/RNase